AERSLMNSFFSLLLTVAILLSSLFGAAGLFGDETGDSEPYVPAIAVQDTATVLADDDSTDTDASVNAAQRLASLRPESAPLPYEDIDYEHYDPDYLHDAADELLRLAEAGEADGVIELYDAMYDDMLYIDALCTLTMLRSDADIYDEYWAEEYAYSNLLWSEAEDILCSAGHDILKTDCAEAFVEHVGDETADWFFYYEPLTQSELDDYDRQFELFDEYRILYDTIYDIEYSYHGKSWTLESLYGFSGSVLAETDYDAYLAIYNGLQQALCETFAPIYIELVSLWNEEARRAGYDSFTDYAYECYYARDYTPEDAQLLCDAVKPIARQYYADLYYSDMYYAVDTVGPVYSSDELLAILGEYLPRVDDALLEPWNELTTRNLYDLAPIAAGRFDGAYSTSLLYFRSPFLFASLEGSCYDLTTLTHEFGHFADYWFSPQTNIFTQTDDLDLSEIHSNALQALFTSFYSEIYTDGADVAEFANLSDLLENILDGCIYDEFQRRIFEETEPLTPERINAIHTQVCSEYGLYDEAEWDSTWVYISHNFEQPLYYISYAASAVAALQIWNIAQTDFDAASDIYMDVLRHGAHDEGYFTVLEECGLQTFREENAAADVCQLVLDRLEALDAAYTG
ncbi:MAG: M3 family metallopeptidase, partial [Faecousia sp.]